MTHTHRHTNPNLSFNFSICEENNSSYYCVIHTPRLQSTVTQLNYPSSEIERSFPPGRVGLEDSKGAFPFLKPDTPGHLGSEILELP
ncbi:hypothetical protein CEXT_698561 [Caerostris extrusa]|uniref:Uncharacterized protein n=1 Tax=Caerostris extrusa TaxID=172846 RepID=A0AAV4PX94_CAEEX|nr:hypothetical protein CEXT_698561 [Caerostris extrusa]